MAGPQFSGLQDHRDAPRGRHATTHGQNFPRVVGWTLLGSVVPGVGLIAAGRRTLGGAVLFVTALLGSAAVTYAVIGKPTTLVKTMLANPNDFVIVAGVLIALVVAWAVIVVGTHASVRRYAHLGNVQRVLCALLVTSLIGIVAIPTAKAGSYALILRDTLTTVFGSGGTAAAPVGASRTSGPPTRGPAPTGSTCCSSGRTPAPTARASGPTR